MITKKTKDALTEKKVKINGVPFIHRVTENKFDKVETWVRADGHGAIRKTDDDRFGARYEMWNDIAKKYETRVIEPKDEIEEVVDLMEEDISEGEYKKKAREEGRKRMMGDAKVDSKYVVMHPKKNLYLTVGGKTWSEEDDPMIKKFKSEADAEAYAKKNTTNFRIAVFDAKADGKAVWVMRENEDFWRPWGLRDWTEEDLAGYRDEFKKKGYKKVILVENDGTNPNETKDTMKVYDDYGWTIPSDKAWDAYESVKEIMGSKKLLLSMEFAMGEDEIKKAVKDIATDWDEETEDIDELVELSDYEGVLDEIAQWLSSDELADYLAFICRMNDLEIPELVSDFEDSEEIEVDDALWVNSDNNASSAGVLTAKLPIKYNGYLILTREDGMFDVYTRGTFNLVGTEFKSIEEAKKSIDEGRTEQHKKTIVKEELGEESPGDLKVESIEEEEDEDEEEVQPTVKADPNLKMLNYDSHLIKKNDDGTWAVFRGGKDVFSRKRLKTGLTSFAEAVEWMFDNTPVKLPDGSTKQEQILMEYLPEKFKR